MLEVAAISQRVKFLPFAISQQLLAIGLQFCPFIFPSFRLVYSLVPYITLTQKEKVEQNVSKMCHVVPYDQNWVLNYVMLGLIQFHWFTVMYFPGADLVEEHEEPAVQAPGIVRAGDLNRVAINPPFDVVLSKYHVYVR